MDRHVPKAGDESLLTRVYKVPETPLEKAYIRTLRRGKREVNGFKGEELLDLLPTPGAIKQHYFHWEALGNVKDIFVPLLDLDLETATRPMKGPRPRPSLSDDQAIKLYDTILSTVRLRPTIAPVNTHVDEQPMKLLGERVATGRTCPQTGWWQSEDEGGRGMAPAALQGGRRVAHDAAAGATQSVAKGQGRASCRTICDGLAACGKWRGTTERA